MASLGVRLSQWARDNGLTRKGAWRLYRAGQLPCPAKQLPTAAIIVYPQAHRDTQAALYARVSSHDQKADLGRQLERLRAFAAGRGLAVSAEYQEVGSGLNGRRQKLLALLRDTAITTLVVEHRDRLARFGVEYIEASMQCADKSLVVADETEKADDWVPDFIDGVTSMCARIYGKRAAKNRAARAIKAASED